MKTACKCVGGRSLRFRVHLLTFMALLVLCTLAYAEERTVRFPKHMCTITLPGSSEWRVLPHELINDPEMILVAFASDGKVGASLSVVELKLENKNEAEETVKSQAAFMKSSGLEVTNIQKKDFRSFPGWWITSKGKINGNETVQTTWTVFANDRVYVFTGSMMGADLSAPVAKRAAEVLTGMEIDTKSQEGKVQSSDGPNVTPAASQP